MNREKDNLLSLGSVVNTENDDVFLMIIGYFPVNQDTGETYTYLAVPLPFGVSYDDMVLLNEDDINSVEYYGYEDEQIDNFKKQVLNYIDNSES